MSGNDIVAIATPPGRGAISIVRLSGAGIPTLCRALIGELPKPRTATLCDFRDGDGAAMDRGLALYFAAPHSYTGEPALELHGHGSPLAMNMLLRRCLELGARLARPGEFSERAFLNGRLDLAQAEAVADLIESSTEAAARSAMRSLQGEFSARIHALVGELTELRVVVEAAIDFPEESVDFGGDLLSDARVTTALQNLQSHFAELRASAKQGKLLRDGLKVVLTGPPNAGKSSLLNRLSRQPRAIVSAIPGTTRDVLEQVVELDGLPVEIVDTAGLRSGADEIEMEGVRRAVAAQQQADLILLVLDDADTTPPQAERWLARVRSQLGDNSAVTDSVTGAESETDSVCVVRNKIDLSGRRAGVSEHGIAVSALHGDGLDELIAVLKQRAGFRSGEDNCFIARQRHVDALQRANRHLQVGIKQIATVGGVELFAEELNACQQAVGEITGQVGSDDLLGLIFSTFCIGK